ncbi:MAG: class I fructose-bisphosphate aldolase [Anaerolineaceae bacterium]
MSSTGEKIRLSKLFNGSENVVIVAVDHGLYFGPLPGMIDLPGVIASIAGADGILMGPGMPAHCQNVFYRRNAPSLIIRLNWGTNYAAQWKYKHSHSVMMISAADAVREGADMVIGSLTLRNPDEAEDAENVRIYSECVSQKKALGIPMIGEVYPTGGDDSKPEDLQQSIYIGCRMAAELGADLVKTFYTGPKFEDITKATPVPVLALGAKKTPREIDALQLAADAVNAGARGIVFGRNVLQARSPERLLDALKEVVKANKSPQVVAAKFGLQ